MADGDGALDRLTLDAALIVTDADGVVSHWDQGATDLYGHVAADAVGRSIIELMVPASHRDAVADIFAAVLAGEGWHGAFTVRRADGASVDALVALLPLRDDTGVVGIAGLSVPGALDGAGPGAIDRAASALVAANMGVWDWDLTTGRLSWDSMAAQLQGVDENPFAGDIDRFFSRVHPDDLVNLQDALQRSLVTLEPLVEEFRVIREDGSTAWVQARGRAYANADGAPVRMVGVGFDTSMIRAGRDRASRMLDHLDDGLLMFDTAWNITYVNLSAARTLGRDVADVLGRNLWEEFPEAVGSEAWSRYHEAMQTQQSSVFEVHFEVPHGWMELRLFPAPDGLAVEFHDVNARKLAEGERDALHARLAFLAHASDALSVSLDEDAVLSTLAELVVADWADWCCVYLHDGAVLRRAMVRHRDPSMADAAERLRDEPPVAIDSGLWIAETFRTADANLNADIDRAMLQRELPATAVETVETLGARSGIVAPLAARDQPLGVLGIFRSGDPAFAPDDVGVAAQLAARAALAVQNARLYEHERSVADALQQAVLPDRLPAVDGWELAARYLPATEGARVGGDFYDAYVTDGQLVVAVGDVAGHGMRAAAVMGQVRNALRGFTLDHLDPEDVVRRSRRLLRAREPDELVTMLFGVIDLASGDMSWTSAGHPPPIVVSDGAARMLEVTGCPPLGAPPPVDAPPATHHTTIPCGATVVLFTDGLVERRDESLALGFERLLKVAPRLDPSDATSLDDVIAELVPQRRDDICILVLRRSAR